MGGAAPSGVTHVSRTLDGGGTWTEVEQIHGLSPGMTAQFFSSDEAVLVGQPAGYPSASAFAFTPRETVFGGPRTRRWPWSDSFEGRTFSTAREGWLLTANRQNGAMIELWHTLDAGAHCERLTDSSDSASCPRPALSAEACRGRRAGARRPALGGQNQFSCRTGAGGVFLTACPGSDFGPWPLPLCPTWCGSYSLCW